LNQELERNVGNRRGDRPVSEPGGVSNKNRGGRKKRQHNLLERPCFSGEAWDHTGMFVRKRGGVQALLKRRENVSGKVDRKKV